MCGTILLFLLLFEGVAQLSDHTLLSEVVPSSLVKLQSEKTSTTHQQHLSNHDSSSSAEDRLFQSASPLYVQSSGESATETMESDDHDPIIISDSETDPPVPIVSSGVGVVGHSCS